MSNTERVNLNINIQLQSLRAAFSELSKLQAKVNEIQSSTISSSSKIISTDPSRGAVASVYNMMDDLGTYAATTQKRVSDTIGSVAKTSLDSSRMSVGSVYSMMDDMGKASYIENIKRPWDTVAKTINDNIPKVRKGLSDIDTSWATSINKMNRMSTQWVDSARMAFSLHIVQAYIQPFVNALKQAVIQSLTVFAEFEKYYADYVAKSADFESVMSRSEIFKAGVGQTYSVNEMADAMERFAASGIDITKNEQALTDVLQLATTASISYTDAANSVIKTQEAFQLSITDSTMIVDALTNSANASTAELKDLTEWFGYASGMAHETGINVQQLAAYLGVLSSMGMKSAGTAMRQMLVQMTDENVREKLNAVFGQEFDYMQMDQTILKMREFIQNSSNQAEVIQKVSNALGGKVNAREALSRLLTADDATWSRIMNATERSGTAASLFEKMTDNASANMQRIKNNITIIVAQLGQVFEPLINVAMFVTNVLATIANNTPGFIKTAAGGFLLLAGVGAVAITMFASLVGLYYVVHAANLQFAEGHLAASFSVKSLAVALSELTGHLVKHITLTNTAASTTQRWTAANLMTKESLMGATGMMLAGAGAMVAYMGQQYAMEQQAYSLARALNLVAALLAGVSAAMAVGGGPQGLLVGGAVGLGVAYSGQKSITRAEETATLQRRRTSQYGKSDVTQFNDTGAKNYFTISNVNVSGVSNAQDFATGLYEETTYV